MRPDMPGQEVDLPAGPVREERRRRGQQQLTGGALTVEHVELDSAIFDIGQYDRAAR